MKKWLKVSITINNQNETTGKAEKKKESKQKLKVS